MGTGSQGIPADCVHIALLDALHVTWTYTGLGQPPAGEPVLGAWRINGPYPGAVNGWSYQVAVWTGRDDWHDPETGRVMLEPMYWRSISAPDHPANEAVKLARQTPLENYIGSLGSSDQPRENHG